MTQNPLSVPNRVHELPHNDYRVIPKCSIKHYNTSCAIFSIVNFSNMTNSELSF